MTELLKHHTDAWERCVLEVTGDADIAKRVVSLAALNGLFDIHKDWAHFQYLSNDERFSPEAIGVRVRGLLAHR